MTAPTPETERCGEARSVSGHQPCCSYCKPGDSQARGHKRTIQLTPLAHEVLARHHFLAWYVPVLQDARTKGAL